MRTLDEITVNEGVLDCSADSGGFVCAMRVDPFAGLVMKRISGEL